VPNPLIYPDLATAVRTQLSSGPARAAIQHSGLPAVRGALTRAFAGNRKPDGSYRQENVFRSGGQGLTLPSSSAPIIGAITPMGTRRQNEDDRGRPTD
jgi:hypothetical protein